MRYRNSCRVEGPKRHFSWSVLAVVLALLRNSPGLLQGDEFETHGFGLRAQLGLLALLVA